MGSEKHLDEVSDPKTDCRKHRDGLRGTQK